MLRFKVAKVFAVPGGEMCNEILFSRGGYWLSVDCAGFITAHLLLTPFTLGDGFGRVESSPKIKNIYVTTGIKISTNLPISARFQASYFRLVDASSNSRQFRLIKPISKAKLRIR
jgi:hypothetical protein